MVWYKKAKCTTYTCMLHVYMIRDDYLHVPYTTNVPFLLLYLRHTSVKTHCLFILNLETTCTISRLNIILGTFWEGYLSLSVSGLQQILPYIPTLCNQSLLSTSPIHLPSASDVSTRIKFRELLILSSRFSSNFPVPRRSMSRNTEKPRSWRCTLRRLKGKLHMITCTGYTDVNPILIYCKPSHFSCPWPFFNSFANF